VTPEAEASFDAESATQSTQSILGREKDEQKRLGAEQ